MNASPEQINALRAVARGLGPLRKEVVFVGGMMNGLLITNHGAPIARPTEDVDLIVQVASTVEYQKKLSSRLRARGFREDSRQGAPICRWLLGPFAVDVMPAEPGVLGFSNRWYRHAFETAKAIELPADAEGSLAINVITATAFCATKLVAWKARGEGDLLHHDIEDIVALVDGRAGLLSELESEAPELRKFVAAAVSSLLKAGLEDQLGAHLQGDKASQGRRPIVLTTLNRIARHPRILKAAETMTAKAGGDPGATGVPSGAPWDWEVLTVEKATASKPPVGSSHIAVVARLTSHSATAGTTGDGRDVFVEDSTGRRFRPLDKLLHAERSRRGMPEPYDQVLPHEPFDTVWVYELPENAKGLRLLLPFDNVELPFGRPT